MINCQKTQVMRKCATQQKKVAPIGSVGTIS